MTKKNILLFIVLHTAAFLTSFGQEVDETPQHFGQFYNNPLINLSRNGLDSKVEIAFDNQRNIGGFSGVSTSYFGLFFAQQSKKRRKRKSKNVYGLYIYDDIEGDLISRRRVNLSYATHQQLSKKWTLSLALSGGLYLFGIKPSKTTRAYSANSFEGNSSLLLYSKQFQIGVSMNQFTNSSVQPAQQITRLKRHYYIFSQYKWRKNKIDLIPSVFVRYMNLSDPLSSTKGTIAGGSFRAVYKIIMAGVTADSYGVYLSTGLNNWNLFGNEYNMDFSYFVPTAANTINVNRMEVNLRMKINGRKKVTFFN